MAVITKYGKVVYPFTQVKFDIVRSIQFVISICISISSGITSISSGISSGSSSSGSS